MKIGVYVGSFNPVHKGHIEVARHLIKENIVDKVLMLPTPNYWDKQDLIGIDKRVEMLKLCEEENIKVDTVHNNHPFTYEVLESLKEDYKDDELYLIIGADNLEKFYLWKNFDEIMKNKVIVLPRDGIDIESLLSKYDKTRFVIANGFSEINVSSTEIRENKDSSYLDEKVRKYIEENNLYGK